MPRRGPKTPASRTPRFLALTLILVLPVLLAGCKGSSKERGGAGGGGGAAEASNASGAVAPFAPSFTVQTFDRSEFSLEAMRGNPVVINFFASWCPPCRDEAGDLQKAYTAFRGEGVRFIGIAVEDDELDTRGFIKEFKWTFPAAPDETGELMKAYSVLAVPKTVVVGRDGRVSYTHTGAITEEILSREIRKAL